MIPLSTITYELSDGCSGFTVTDNTNYAALSTPTFSLLQFILGLRVINIIAPDGSNKIYSDVTTINNIGYAINVDGTYVTSIPNLNTYTPTSWTFFETQQGAYQVQILSIPQLPPIIYPYISTDYLTGDITVVTLGTQYVIYQALVDNPTTDITDTAQWRQIVLLQNFTLSVWPSVPLPGTIIASNYLNSVSILEDCYLSSYTCVVSSLSCGFCCGKCDDILSNKTSVAIIKASLLVAEIQVVGTNNLYSFYRRVPVKVTPRSSQSATPPIPSITQYSANLVCMYSQAIKKICCCKPEPCKPCEDDVVNDTTTQVITPANIASVMNGIIDEDFTYNLKRQVTLGKNLCCKDRKILLAFLVANTLSIIQIPVSITNLNCLGSILSNAQTANPSSQTRLLGTSKGVIAGNNKSNYIKTAP